MIRQALPVCIKHALRVTAGWTVLTGKQANRPCMCNLIAHYQLSIINYP